MVKNETPVKALSFVVHVKITVEIQQSKVRAMGLKMFYSGLPQKEGGYGDCDLYDICVAGYISGRVDAGIQ